MAVLEQAVINAKTEAEADGFAEELQVLYRSAEVRYVELAEADKAIQTAEKELTVAVETANAPASSTVTTAANQPVSQTSDEVENTEIDTAALPEEAITYSESTPTRPDYYFVLPEAIVESFFEVNATSVYSDARPIPVDAPMPEGLVYKVQVGAYRKPIPQDLFRGFAPLRGEKLDNGITRYTAGVFVGFSDADEAKNSIRQLGYRDAFVVAYYNGKRISLNEARDRQPEVASTAAAAANSTRASNAESNTTSRANAANSSAAPASTAAVAAVPTFAETWSSNQGVWLTVQVGVYSRPVTLADLYNVANVMAEPLDAQRIRYTSGKFNTLTDAQRARDAARAAGIEDAFLTAYINGQRVPVGEALAQLGSGAQQPAQPRQNASASQQTGSVQSAPTAYRLKIGAFDGQVPAATVTALLNLEASWEIEQQETANGIVFYSRNLVTRAEAEAALNAFFQYGATAVTIEEVNP